MAKVLKRNNTKKNRNTNKKINKSRKNTKGGLRLTKPNMDCGSPFSPKWSAQQGGLRLTKPNMDCGSPFSPQWAVQEGGHRWREHVRKVMKQHPQEKFGKVLAIAKKTYKKTGGARKNRRNKTQKKKQSAGSRKNRKSKNIRRKQSGGQELTTEQKQEMRDAFNMFDLAGNGEINWEELQEATQTYLGKKITEEEAKQQIADVDTDGNGTIDFDEFVKMMQAEQEGLTEEEQKEKELRQAFEVFNKDGTGFLSQAEFYQAMNATGNKMTEEQVDDEFRKYDIDGDGKISFEEFEKMMGPKEKAKEEE
jgi:Ca2+-binding EF-hand superfamily protein